VPNENSIAKQLLERLPREKQLLLMDAFRKHGIYERDPIILLFLEVLENQDKSIAKGLHGHQKILEKIYDSKTWKKLLTSKFVSWVAGPVIGASIVLYGIHYQRKNEIDQLKRVLQDPPAIGALISDSARGLEQYRREMKALISLVGFIQVPESSINFRGKVMTMTFKKDQVAISEEGDTIKIRLEDQRSDLARILERMSQENEGGQGR
jgi:hypothetical protein